MSDVESPIEEWLTSSKGRQYAVIRGPGGGTVFRKGDESVDEARARRAIEQEAKRRQQRAGGDEPRKPGRPRGKGRKPDPKPSGATVKPPAGKPKPSREQLAAAAELPLQVVGAFVGRQVLQCEYCTGAMIQNAPNAARDLAASANPYLVNLLTWWHGLISSFAGGDGLVMYLAPPIVHHALPGPAAEIVSPFLGVPPRPPRSHSHASPQPPGEGSARQPPPPAPGQAAGAAPPPPNGQPQPRPAPAPMGPPNVPPYRAEDRVAPGTPAAPPVDPADAAGSPLPPEAGG